MKAEYISSSLGLGGALFLSEGDSLTAQGLFSLANPILAFEAWKAGAKTTALLFAAYEFFSLKGLLSCLSLI